MTSLEWIIGQLVADLTQYISDNKEFRILRDAYLKDEATANETQAASSSTASTPASTTETAPTLGAVVAATASTTTDPETSTTSFDNVEATASYAATLTWVAGSLLKPISTGLASYALLKAEKVTEAEKLTTSLSMLRANVSGLHEMREVEAKIQECLSLINREIELMVKIRGAEEHKQEPGKYDALLLAHKQIFEWLQSPKGLSTLCICLRAESPSKFTTTGYGKSQKKNYTHVEQIPLCKEFLNDMVRTCVEVQSDKARFTQQKLLSYQLMIPETAQEKLMHFLPRAMNSLNSFNNMYVTYLNGCTQTTPDNLRLTNFNDVVTALLHDIEAVANEHSAYLGLSGNTFLTTLVAKLKSYKDKAETKLKELEVNELGAKIATASSSASMSENEAFVAGSTTAKLHAG